MPAFTKKNFLPFRWRLKNLQWSFLLPILKKSNLFYFLVIEPFHFNALLTPYYRHGICQMFYTSKIPKKINFTQEKSVNGDIFGNNWEWRIFYSFCENSKPNSVKHTEKVFFAKNLEKISWARKNFKKVLLATLVTNSTFALLTLDQSLDRVEYVLDILVRLFFF